ncbi:MAG TPA: M67 family metallopeptidase [Acidimicrobiia bacterium]|nr:M67 family metallopeptidase [Acidimicrobiia bacterium]
MSIPAAATPTLRMTRRHHDEMVAHCYDGLPDEACGLLAGPVDGGGVPIGPVTAVFPTANADASARTYTVDSRDHIKALRAAEAGGGDLIGVFHSHTHTEPYPSETDVRAAVEPHWLYVIVGLRRESPEVRAYRIRDGRITDVPIEITR